MQHERIEKFKEIKEALKTDSSSNSMCINSNKLNGIVMKHRFGTPSAYGEAWIANTVKINNSKLGIIKVAVKKMPVTHTDLKDWIAHSNLMTGESTWNEIIVFLLCNSLVLSNICPNLPIMYSQNWCESCSFENKKIRGPSKRPCLLVTNELADGDLKMLLKTTKIWNEKLVKNCIFQICAGLYALKKYYNVTHNDLHYGNVLFHKIPAGGYWRYQINKKQYYLENLGYLFVLWDFGMASIPGRMRPKHADKDVDIVRICWIMKDVLKGKGNLPILNFIKGYGHKIELGELIRVVFAEFNLQPPRNEVLEEFNMDTSKSQLNGTHPKHLKHFLTRKVSTVRKNSNRR